MVTIITEKLQNQTLEDVQAAEQNMPITQVRAVISFSILDLISTRLLKTIWQITKHNRLLYFTIAQIIFSDIEKSRPYSSKVKFLRPYSRFLDLTQNITKKNLR